MSTSQQRSIPEPLELVIKGREQEGAAVYGCPECGLLFSPAMFGGGKGGLEQSRTIAVEHCHRTCDCGKALEKGSAICRDCWGKRILEMEEKKYSIAKKVYEKDYNDPVFWECHEGSMGDGYFSNIDELREYCEDEDIEVPAYAWACRSVDLNLDVDRILEGAFEAHFEGARDALSTEAEKELEEFITMWCQKQNISSWQTDFTRVVILGEPPI